MGSYSRDHILCLGIFSVTDLASRVLDILSGPLLTLSFPNALCIS